MNILLNKLKKDMTKHAILVMIMVTAIMFVSCESTSFNSRSYRTKEANTIVISEPLVIEYDTVMCQVVRDTSIFRGQEGQQDFTAEKKRAIANCCKKKGIDLLLNPMFDVTCADNKITVVVWGLPVNYKRVRPATKDDVWMMQMQYKD